MHTCFYIQILHATETNYIKVINYFSVLICFLPSRLKLILLTNCELPNPTTSIYFKGLAGLGIE